jgi:hypothetical protein
MLELKLIHLLQPRVLVEFANDQIFERLPYALLAMGVVVGGFFVTYIIKLLLSKCCLPRKNIERYVLKSKKGHRKVFRVTTRKRWGSIAHLILETFFFIAIVLVLWIGAHVAGFNFWTSSMVGVGLGLVGT